MDEAPGEGKGQSSLPPRQTLSQLGSLHCPRAAPRLGAFRRTPRARRAMAALLLCPNRLHSAASTTASASARPSRRCFISFSASRSHHGGPLLASPAAPPSPALAVAEQPFRALPASETTVLVTGATGYIGRYVVWELLRRGHCMLAVACRRSGIRGRNSPEDVVADLAPARVVFSDVTDPGALRADLAPHGPVHAAVCCLTSRGGGVRDSWRVDYEATLHTLSAARALGAAHFVLLSAICVQKPLLEFQRAKLKFEEDLAAEAARDPAFTYSVVRPTAFFKSLGGQVESVKNGGPYVMFGDGKLCGEPVGPARYYSSLRWRTTLHTGAAKWPGQAIRLFA